MKQASMEAEEADAIGITTQPAAPLRRMIRQPPPWLPRVIEVAVQARQACAVELEYETPKDSLVNMPLSPAKAVRPGLPKPPPSRLEEIAELHEEAARLAQRLLPEDSDVRLSAERAYRNSVDRHEARHSQKTPGLRATALAPVA